MDDGKVPLDQVLKDMYDPYSAVSGAARDYYYREYATEEERKEMDREDRINTIVAGFILGFIIVGMAGLLLDLLQGG